ncbi:MAG TPA: cytochrome c [Bacteroidia bacterium]|jgi:mono/diheme cytochrome c family protein|nr:cytochrome c [Bacteroidia bacterium]
MKTLKKRIGIVSLVVFTVLFTGLLVSGDPQWVAPPDAQKLTNPVQSDATTLAEGQKIFRLNCQACHGTKGKGDGVAAAGLAKHPANFTSPVVVGETDGALFWKITNGNNPMPSFKKNLTDQQRWEAVICIRDFQKTK